MAVAAAMGSGGEERRVTPDRLEHTEEEKGGLERSRLVPGRLGGTDTRDRSRRGTTVARGGVHGKGAGGLAHGQRQRQLVSMHSINPAATAATAAAAAAAAAAGDGGGGVGRRTPKKKKAKPKKKKVMKKDVNCAMDMSKRNVASPGMSSGGNDDNDNPHHEEPSSLSSSSFAPATATSPAEAEIAVLGDPRVACAATVVPAATPVSRDRGADAASAAAGHGGGGFCSTAVSSVAGYGSTRRTPSAALPDGGGGTTTSHAQQSDGSGNGPVVGHPEAAQQRRLASEPLPSPLSRPPPRKRPPPPPPARPRTRTRTRPRPREGRRGEERRRCR
ncbi:unnamed protein product [Ectocarpus fasciculatus]